MKWTQLLICAVLNSITSATTATLNHSAQSVSSYISIPDGQPSSLYLQNSTFADSTLRNPDADSKDFRFTVIFRSTKLTALSCLMISLNLLAALAELNWLSQTPPGQIRINSPEYPDVSISFWPSPPRSAVDVRVLVLGVYHAIHMMFEQKRFMQADFGLYWKEECVAALSYEKRSSTAPLGNEAAVSENNINNVFHPRDNASNTHAISGTAATLGTDQLDVVFFYDINGKILPLQTVFITAMAVLKNLAIEDSDMFAQPFCSGASGLEAHICFFTKPVTHSGPPYYRYRHVTQAIAWIPKHMFAQKRFAELSLLVEIDQVAMGTGVILAGALPQSAIDSE